MNYSNSIEGVTNAKHLYGGPYMFPQLLVSYVYVSLIILTHAEKKSLYGKLYWITVDLITPNYPYLVSQIIH